MEELCSAVRDRMVFDLIATERKCVVRKTIGTVEELSEVDNEDEAETSVAAEEQQEDMSDDAHHIASDILHVISMKPADGFYINATKIINAMTAMHMKKREKGSITGTQKFNSLRGRWFGEATEVVKEKEGSVIKR